jgi:hypothetical protein
MLQEPAKAELLRYEAGAGPAPRRQALCVVISIPDGQVAEALVDLAGGSAAKDAVQSWRLVRGSAGGLAVGGLARCLPACPPARLLRPSSAAHAACGGRVGRPGAASSCALRRPRRALGTPALGARRPGASTLASPPAPPSGCGRDPGHRWR